MANTNLIKNYKLDIIKWRYPFLIFTGIFVAVYAVIWTIVYLCIRNSGKKINYVLNKQ